MDARLELLVVRLPDMKSSCLGIKTEEQRWREHSPDDVVELLHPSVPEAFSPWTFQKSEPPATEKGSVVFFCLFVFCFFFFLLGPHLQHMEIPRLGVESELQLSA